MSRQASHHGLRFSQVVTELLSHALRKAAAQSANHSVIAILVGSVALGASPTQANWLSSHDLDRHCGAYLSDPISTAAAGCIAFVQGYVAAAGAGSNAQGDAESFAERAARTRAGSRLRGAPEQLASRRAFCVAGTPPAVVIEAVANYLSRAARAEDEPPEQRVHRALVAQFPCSDD